MTNKKDDLDEIFDKALEHGSVKLTDENNTYMLLSETEYQEMIDLKEKLQLEIIDALNEISKKVEENSND